MMAQEIMIDLETLDTDPSCVILTIGAVLFDPMGEGVTETIYLRPTIEEQTEKFNRTINDSTMKWWSTQSTKAQNEAMGDQDRVTFKDAMESLYKFCWNRKAFWSHGAPFDLVVMESAWRQLGMKFPWAYHTLRDTRTLFDITGVRLTDAKYTTKTTHNALEDALHQVTVVQDAYKKLNARGVFNK